MKHQVYFVFIFSFILSSCVSVNLPSSTQKKAQNLQYTEPAEPFKVISDKTADLAWSSKATGNSISVLSDCTSNDSATEQIKLDTINSLSKLKVIKDEVITYNGREALSSHVSGELDGVPVQMKVLVFKKNSCSFLISYVGVKKHFEKDLDKFNRFVEGFKVPSP